MTNEERSMEKFCRTWENLGDEVDAEVMESFLNKTQIGFLARKAWKALKNPRPVAAFESHGDGTYTFKFKSATSGITAFTQTLGPFKLNGSPEDTVSKRPDGQKFHVVFSLSEDGSKLTQTNSHVAGKIPDIVTTREVKADDSGTGLTFLHVSQECDGVVIHQRLQEAVDFKI